MSETRKAGVSVVVGSQAPGVLGSSIHSNAYAKIFLSLSSGKDLGCMINGMGIRDPQQKEYCYNLKPREAVCKLPFLEAFLVKIKEINL
jgi:hypothetical protein